MSRKIRHRTPRNRQRRAGRSLMFVVSSLVVVGLLGAGVWWYWSGSGQATTVQPLTTKVVSAAFDHTVVEQGEVESSLNVDIRCQVKSRNAGGTDILWVIPEGTIVEQGQELVKIDSSALEQERDAQKIICNTSLATKVQSQNAYDTAVIARTEYLEGTFKQEKQTIQSEIFVAEETLRRADQYAKYSERLALKGYVTSPQLEGDRFAVYKAKNDLELAKNKLFVSENYTREKMLRTLESDIASTKAKWDADEESYKLELKKLADMEQQVAVCVIRAPQAGQVVYASVPNSRGGSAEFIVEAGAKVREGQTIMRMPDTRRMQVRAKINESRVTFIRPDQPVTIRIDALDGAVLQGRVKRVSSFAEPTSFFGSNTKQYATEITIIDPPGNIRTGLTAEVNIHLEHADSALQVPVQAVLENAGKTYCLVQNGERWEPVEVKMGSTNDKFIRIESGLSVDQVVAANPRQHLDLFPFIKNGVIEPSPSAVPGNATAIAANLQNLPPLTAGPGPAPGGDKKKRPSAAETFTSLDGDKDGKLTTEELSALDQRMRDNIGNADSSGDGLVDQSELTAAMAKARAAFKKNRPEGAEGNFGGPPMGVGE